LPVLDFWEMLWNAHQRCNGLLTSGRKRHASFLPLAARSLP
jgi:hypothetical protein